MIAFLLILIVINYNSRYICSECIIVLEKKNLIEFKEIIVQTHV